MTENDLFDGPDECLCLGSENEKFKIEWKDNSLNWNDELNDKVQRLFENCDILLFAVHILNLKGEDEVKRSGVRYTLKDVLPVGKDKNKHSFLKVSLMFL